MRLRNATLLVTVSALAAGGCTGRRISAEEPAVDRLRWLVGCWTARSDDGTVTVEQWQRPGGDTLFGSSRTERDGRVVRAETFRIYARPDGVVAYHAEPSGQAAASFTASIVTDTRAVFENPQHAFLQTIEYARVRADSLRVSIAGPRGGDVRRTFFFTYARTSCR